MGLWSILIPLAITNLVANPSFEVGLTGYTAVNGAIARTLTKQRRGAASGQVTPAASAYGGARYDITLAAATPYTFSADVWAELGLPYRIYITDGADTILGTAVAFTGTGDWQRVAVTATTTGGTGYRLYVPKNNSASVAPFYLDGFQCAALGYDVSYCDGDQTDAIWNGAAHQSTSQRGADSRAGGREIFLEDYTGLTVRTSSGLGMPPAQHLVEEQAFIPGARFAGSKVKARTLDLVIDLVSSSRDTLHSLRKLLLSAIDPEITPDEQPFILRYYGANPNKPLEIAAVYDSGLEMGETAHFQETLQMRMIAYDPWWREIGNTAAQITTSQTIAQANYVLGRVNGAWRDLDQGMAGSVYALANGTDGAMYAGGLFATTFRGVAANKIAKWDGAAWSALGSGLNNTVWAITIGPDGSLYAGGTFT
ncbi:MAG TPA: carbohydrate binding domain-containing protein, partial [Anaerolineales bacterium]